MTREWFPGYAATGVAQDRSGPLEFALGEELAARIYAHWDACWGDLIKVGGVAYATCRMMQDVPAQELAAAIGVSLEEAEIIKRRCAQRA